MIKTKKVFLYTTPFLKGKKLEDVKIPFGVLHIEAKKHGVIYTDIFNTNGK